MQPTPISFRDVELTPHLGGSHGPGALAVAAGDDAVWVMGERRVLRIEPGGEVRPALDAPGTDIFVQLSAAGRHVAVATYDGDLFVSRDGQPFAPVRPPERAKQSSVRTLLAGAEGGLWVGLAVGQPVERRWWCRDTQGRWERRRGSEADLLVERYGVVRPARQIVSPCLGRDGTLVALADWREPNPDADEDGEAPLYVRRQILVELTADGWSEIVDLEAAGVPRVLSGCGDALWNGSVAVAPCVEGGEPVWLVGRADASYRVSRGRAERVALGACELVSDGGRSALAIGELGDDGEEASLHLSRDAGSTFDALPALAPWELARGGGPPYRAGAAFFEGALLLALVARESRDRPPTRARIVRAG